jgi:hypothetical protein
MSIPDLVKMEQVNSEWKSTIDAFRYGDNRDILFLAYKRYRYRKILFCVKNYSKGRRESSPALCSFNAIREFTTGLCCILALLIFLVTSWLILMGSDMGSFTLILSLVLSLISAFLSCIVASIFFNGFSYVSRKLNFECLKPKTFKKEMENFSNSCAEKLRATEEKLQQLLHPQTFRTFFRSDWVQELWLSIEKFPGGRTNRLALVEISVWSLSVV